MTTYPDCDLNNTRARFILSSEPITEKKDSSDDSAPRCSAGGFS